MNKTEELTEKIAKFAPEGYHVFMLTHNELVKEKPRELWRMYADGILFKTTKARQALFDCIEPLEKRYGSKIDGRGIAFGSDALGLGIIVIVDSGSIEYDGPFTDYKVNAKKSELKVMVDDIVKWCNKKKIDCIRLKKEQAELVRKLLISPYKSTVQI